jgi:GTPase SAR1 family protein
VFFFCVLFFHYFENKPPKTLLKGALLVFDITDNDTFVRVQNWVKELRKMLGKDVALAIAGNKCDLERNRVVSEQDAKTYVLNCDYHYSVFYFFVS